MTAMSERSRAATAIGATAVVILLPSALWYVVGSRQVTRETERLLAAAEKEAVTTAAELASRLGARLEDLLENESQRPYVHYWPRFRARERRGDKEHVSPIAAESPKAPVLAYLRIDAEGRVHAVGDGVEVPADAGYLANVFPRSGAREPAADGEIIQVALDDEDARVGPFRWMTSPWDGSSALVALREVRAESGRFVQGFAVESGCLSQWFYNGPFTASFQPGAAERAADAAVSLPGTSWRVRVGLQQALAVARRHAAALRGQFHRSYLGGLLAALLAGAWILVLFRRYRRLAEERARFAAAAAHELRTPLAGIRLHGEMLAHALGSPDRAQTYAHRIVDEAERLGRVVDNVLRVSQAKEHAPAVKREPGDLAACVRECVNRAEPALVAAGARVVVQTRGALSGISFNCDAIARIVQNLLDNAEKHGRGASDRTITVEVAADEAGARIAVQDHGPGLPAGIRKRLRRGALWMPGRATSAGLGLGLPIVLTLAQAHGGFVEATETPGGGASVAVFIPDVRSAHAPLPAEAPA